jgi:hypothetical protein
MLVHSCRHSGMRTLRCLSLLMSALHVDRMRTYATACVKRAQLMALLRADLPAKNDKWDGCIGKVHFSNGLRTAPQHLLCGPSSCIVRCRQTRRGEHT